MKCIYCGAKTMTIDSRDDTDGPIRRRRECPVCGKRFSTKEILADDYDKYLIWKQKKITMHDYDEFMAWKKKKEDHAKYLIQLEKQKEYNRQHKLQKEGA